MTRFLVPTLLISTMAIGACQNATPQDRSNLGLLTGAGAGVLLADAFDANPEWTIVAGIAGAAIGTQVARNTQTGQCAYYAGRNTLGEPVYTVSPC